MSKTVQANKKYRSIRSILIFWFIIFSIIPLVFMGWYFLYKFVGALENELVQRLKNNGREIESIISDYYSESSDLRDYILSKPELYLSLVNKDVEVLKASSTDWTQKSIVSSLSFYDAEGSLIITTYRDDKRAVRYFTLNNEKVLLNEKYLKLLQNKNDIAFIDTSKDRVSLMYFTKVFNSSKKVLGYFEQSIDLNAAFLQRIKTKLKIEGVLLDDKGQVIAASRNTFKKLPLRNENQTLMNFDVGSEKYGFIVYPVTWGQNTLKIGLGTINEDTKLLLDSVQWTFITVISVVSILLMITILVTTKWFLKPVNKLIEGLRTFDTTEQILQLPVSNRTEVGLLTQAFNEMSFKIFQTRADLKKKIKELEAANYELKEAQTKLVHSAKMTSLGQLVAGVAHELNNPISFIFSNMEHLREYAQKLFYLIDAGEKNPEKFEELKNEIEYDYIKSDMPRLIKSCEDGAQRTRDIVLGLRNFSRLEEAQLKEIDVNEALDTTLELLSGEIKNRIQVHLEYNTIPKILCYASQINQVFMNILSNACQAIHGTGQVWITTSFIKAGQDVGKVKVTVQDSGMGMSPDVIEKIFEPFFTTKGIGKGTGLGLSISYGIIQNHGGEIQVRSQKGVGTEFSIIIPVVPPFKKA